MRVCGSASTPSRPLPRHVAQAVRSARHHSAASAPPPSARRWRRSRPAFVVVGCGSTSRSGSRGPPLPPCAPGERRATCRYALEPGRDTRGGWGEPWPPQWCTGTHTEATSRPVSLCPSEARRAPASPPSKPGVAGPSRKRVTNSSRHPRLARGGVCRYGAKGSQRTSCSHRVPAPRGHGSDHGPELFPRTIDWRN